MILANRWIGGPDFRSKQTSQGLLVEALNKPGGSGATVAVTHYRVKSVQGDYLTCRSWDPGADPTAAVEGTTDVYVAKAPELRQSIGSETIFGIQYDYTYGTGPDSNNMFRTSTVHGGTSDVETQLAIPPWYVNREIDAIDAKTNVIGGDGNACGKLMINSPHWAKQ